MPLAPPSVDDQLNQFDALRKQADELALKTQAVAEEIRQKSVELVIVFIDMQDSTSFKVRHYDAPATWITRVRSFCTITARFVEAHRGTVVKYIGDEVMATFPADALANVVRLAQTLPQLQQALEAATREPTYAKMTVDIGRTFLLHYEGHVEADPQGTAVDRCARISRYAQGGLATCSHAFYERCPDRSQWTPLGVVPLKGLGNTPIYCYGPPPSGFALSDTDTDLKLIRSFAEEVSVEIWEKEISRAWDVVHERDYDKERAITLELDRCLDRYDEIVRRYLNGQSRGKALSEACAQVRANAWNRARRCWEMAAEVKAREIPQGKKRKQPEYQEGAEKQRAATDDRLTAQQAIALYRKAVKHFDHCGKNQK